MNYNVMRLENLLSIILNFLLRGGGGSAGQDRQDDEATLHDCKFANFYAASPHQAVAAMVVLSLTHRPRLLFERFAELSKRYLKGLAEHM